MYYSQHFPVPLLSRRGTNSSERRRAACVPNCLRSSQKKASVARGLSTVYRLLTTLLSPSLLRHLVIRKTTICRFADRVFLDVGEGDLDGPFELDIVTGSPCLWIEIDVDVRRYALVLD